MSLWLANVAAVTDKLLRAISIHISLTPPTITKTSRSIYTHIIRAKHFHQQFCQLPLPNSISRACSQVNILFQWKKRFKLVFNNHSRPAKNLESPGHFLSCFLSLFWYAGYWEFKHLYTFLSKWIRDKGSLKADSFFCHEVIATSTVSLICNANLLTFWQKLGCWTFLYSVARLSIIIG